MTQFVTLDISDATDAELTILAKEHGFDQTFTFIGNDVLTKTQRELLVTRFKKMYSTKFKVVSSRITDMFALVDFTDISLV